MDPGLVTRQGEGPTPPEMGVITVDLPPLTSRGVAHIAVGSVMITLVMIWTAMRLCYSGSVTGHVISVSMGGVGHHAKELSPVHIARYSKLSFFAQIIYGPVIGCVKLSILFMLKRIFFTRGFRIAAYFAVFFALCWTLMPILAALLVCSPIEFSWNKKAPGGKCGDKQVAYALVGVVDLISDLLILALPMRMVFNLQIKTAHKVAIASIFGFSVITMIFTAIRLYYIYGMDFTDPTYSTIVPTTIGSVQMGIAIMVASAPLLRPVFDRTIASWFGLSVASSNRRSPKGSGYLGDSSRRSHNNSYGGELLTLSRSVSGANSAFKKKKHEARHLPYHGSASSHARTVLQSGSEECQPSDGMASKLGDCSKVGWDGGTEEKTQAHVSGVERHSRESQD
ncbi:hypothetical protein PG996_012792 [Apiospora saccharicola]|uniref:Rhodopsin domain-containing protein n=1 Tax=Apiospora saccharicola TaxID=335842 RepID=A0ABR1U3M8_9PEZI